MSAGMRVAKWALAPFLLFVSVPAFSYTGSYELQPGYCMGAYTPAGYAINGNGVSHAPLIKACSGSGALVVFIDGEGGSSTDSSGSAVPSGNCRYYYSYEFYSLPLTADSNLKRVFFACPNGANWSTYDTDGDGVLNSSDSEPFVPAVDTDGDGVPDSSDNCPNNANADQADTDGDGIGNVCDTTPSGPDTDGDGVPDSSDNCDFDANPDQADTDHDGRGNACNGDVDNDGDEWSNTLDNCPYIANTDQADTDGDGVGNVCDSTPNGPDADGDGVPDSTDNCDNVANPTQVDTDGDGIGDACEAQNPPDDVDGDGVLNAVDNCPNHANSSQTDTDGDGVGDMCDSTPNGDGGAGAAAKEATQQQVRNAVNAVADAVAGLGVDDPASFTPSGTGGIGNDDKPVSGMGSVTTEGRSLPGVSGCPVDRSLTVLGQNITITMGPICDGAGLLKPFFLAFAFLLAVRIIAV